MHTPHARIQTGVLKGRHIALPQDETTRPTRERIRRSGFNMLESRINFKGLTVLDLCCGSAIAGLEAYSRGATHVTCVDTHTTTARRTVEQLGLAAAITITTADVHTYTPTTPADLIFADPPYGSNILNKLIQRADNLGKIGTWWLLESATEDAINIGALTLVAEKIYGTTKLLLLQQ